VTSYLFSDYGFTFSWRISNNKDCFVLEANTVQCLGNPYILSRDDDTLSSSDDKKDSPSSPHKRKRSRDDMTTFITPSPKKPPPPRKINNKYDMDATKVCACLTQQGFFFLAQKINNSIVKCWRTGGKNVL
jgi:hypothetical protein